MDTQRSVADEVIAALEKLGVSRFHLAAWGSADWGPLVRDYAERLQSLTLAFPALRLGTPDRVDCPVVAFASDVGNGPINTARLVERAPHANVTVFEGYNAALWNDVIADNAVSIVEGMRSFLHAHPLPALNISSARGELDGIRYHVEGSGPPVVVMPIGLVPSQWGPVREALTRDFTVISLSGAKLGMVATLESRANSGYGTVVRALLEEATFERTDKVLEVGCGPGSLVRALARRVPFEQPIAAVDINEYLLDEARALTAASGLGDAIEFSYGNAESLPFEDNHFDLLYCSTVLEEGHADAMLKEFLRVLRPGGRLAVAVRSMDMPWWINIADNPNLRTTLNEIAPRTSSGAGEGGCADSSLYERVLRAGFSDVRKRPQLAIYSEDLRALEVRERLLSMLSGDQAREAADAVAASEAAGTFFAAEPFHGALGTKPTE